MFSSHSDMFTSHPVMFSGHPVVYLSSKLCYLVAWIIIYHPVMVTGDLVLYLLGFFIFINHHVVNNSFLFVVTGKPIMFKFYLFGSVCPFDQLSIQLIVLPAKSPFG